jgi:hypothetical protein
VGFPEDCDPGLQDCPEGLKCTPYVSEPGYCCVDATKCVPIIGDQGYGDICTRTEDNDDCQKGLFCMTQTSGSTGEGTCLEMCSPDDPDACEISGGECVVYADGVMPLCELSCDPLLQDCSAWFGCYPSADTFVCAAPTHEPGEGNDGDDCYMVQSCLPGLVCVVADASAGCTDTDACCTPFCDLSQGTTTNPKCTDPDEECVSWFDEGMAPVGYENVGACLLP